MGSLCCSFAPNSVYRVAPATKKPEQWSELDSMAKGEYNLICFGGGLLHKFGVDPA